MQLYPLGDDSYSYPYLLDDYNLQASPSTALPYEIKAQWKGLPSSTGWTSVNLANTTIDCGPSCSTQLSGNLRLRLSTSSDSTGNVYFDNARVRTWS